MVKTLSENGIPKWATYTAVAVLFGISVFYIRESVGTIKENQQCIIKLASRVDKLETDYRITIDSMKEDLNSMSRDVGEIKKILMRKIKDDNRDDNQ